MGSNGRSGHQVAPTVSVERRLDRLESIEAIRRLVAAYARAVDSRDVSGMVALYTDDTPVSPGTRGRAALDAVVRPILQGFTTSVHLVANHLIDVEAGADEATGAAYCRAEHEVGDRWIVAMLEYSDRYRRDEGEWRFYSRRVRTWYVTDLLDRPSGADKIRFDLRRGLPTMAAADLPVAFPTWEPFWSAAAP